MNIMTRSSSWLWLIVILLAAPSSAETHAQTVRQSVQCSEVYVVQANDWLSKIANKFYGDSEAYQALIEATNQKHAEDPSFNQINNPDAIEAGWKLCVPSPEVAVTLLVESRPRRVPAPVIGPERYTIEDFLAESRFGPELDPKWILSSPPPVKKFQVLARQQAADDAYGYRANYLWNEYLSDAYFNLQIFEAVPEQVIIYRAPWRTVYPRFRYPANVTLPTGLTTNRFGWRGRQIALKKPPNTIRLAAVGASTTVGGHSYPTSYPEFLQHWLNLWSKDQGFGVDFEVINAGREGLGSSDIAAVVRYELLPMDIDYVIYYEGSNQFDPRTMVRYPADVTYGQPPAGLVPNFSNVDSDDKSVLDHLSEYSAVAARARTIVEQFSYTGHEPPKPDQTFHLPQRVDELRPNRRRLNNVLTLTRILDDLDEIKQDLDTHDTKMVMTTFDWFVYDGMVLDPVRHRNLYGYLNRVYWPISYANMRRTADFQNRVFKKWAAANKVPVIDVARRMPRQPDLYADAIHNSILGTRIRAWINFEALIPLLKKDIEDGRLPRPAGMNDGEHPYLESSGQVRVIRGANDP